MNIILFSIFFLRLRIFSRHKIVCMRNLDSYCVSVGSLNVGTVTGRGMELGGYDGTRKVGVLCV